VSYKKNYSFRTNYAKAGDHLEPISKMHLTPKICVKNRFKMLEY
jgi:hypothetical protein